MLVNGNEVLGKAQRNMLVEIDHEQLILRVAGARKGQGGASHIRTLGSHAPTTVNHQSNGDRKVFVAERFNLLQNLIFIDLEGFVGESGDWNALVVSHTCAQDNQAHVGSNRVRADLTRLWNLRHGCAR